MAILGNFPIPQLKQFLSGGGRGDEVKGEYHRDRREKPFPVRVRLGRAGFSSRRVPFRYRSPAPAAARSERRHQRQQGQRRRLHRRDRRRRRRRRRRRDRKRRETELRYREQRQGARRRRPPPPPQRRGQSQPQRHGAGECGGERGDQRPHGGLAALLSSRDAELFGLRLGLWRRPLVAGGSRLPAQPPPSENPPDFASFTARLFALTNALRARRKAPPVSPSRVLAAIARAHTYDQAFALRRISHVGSDGSSLADRAVRFGYRYSTVAENVASGQLSPDHVLRSWMRSRGHRKNILRTDVDHMGVAFVRASDGRLFWTQLFGRRR